MTLQKNEPDILPIYKLQSNQQYPNIQDFINLYKSTTLYILTPKNISTEKSEYIKQDINVFMNEILYPLPSILTFNFYIQKEDIPSFFIMAVKDIIFIVDYDQNNLQDVKNFLNNVFLSLNKTTFIPFTEKDDLLFKREFNVSDYLLPQNFADVLEYNKKLISKFDEFIQKNFRKFNLKEEINLDNFYKQENIYLLSYITRLIYCVNRYFYTNENPKFDFYNQKFSFNENFKETDFFEVMSFNSVSSFNINRNNFAPCSFQYLVNDNNCCKNFENVVEFHKNVRFSSIIPCYGCIRNIAKDNHVLVYKFMVNKNIKHKLNKQKEYFTPEIVSSAIYRISSVIFFLHSNDLIHRKVTISNCYFDSYNRMFLGDFILMLNENGDNDYSNEEFNKEDQQNTKEFDIQSFGDLIIKLFDNVPNCLEPKIKNLALKCLEKKIDASNVLKEILKNNFFYFGNKMNELSFLISDRFDLTSNFYLNIKNTLKSLHVSNRLTLVNQKNSSAFEFNTLMDIQIFILKNRIFEDAIVDLFIQNSWRFAVFGFFKYENNRFSTNYFCICVENYYFLINSYFLDGMKKLFVELSKLILIPVSFEAKCKFDRVVESIENSEKQKLKRNQQNKKNKKYEINNQQNAELKNNQQNSEINNQQNNEISYQQYLEINNRQNNIINNYQNNEIINQQNFGINNQPNNIISNNYQNNEIINQQNNRLNDQQNVEINNQQNHEIINQQNSQNNHQQKIENEELDNFKLKFTFLSEKEIQDIQKAIVMIDKICIISMNQKLDITIPFQFIDNSLNHFIQPLKNTKKYIQFTDFKLPLIGYFMQRIYFESDSFQNSMFFDRYNKFKTYIESNQVKNHLSMNDFQILRLIGSGGSSRVYLAIHHVTLTFVALKIYDTNNENFLIEKNFYEKYGKEKYIIEYYGTFYDKENRGVLVMDFKSNGCISNFYYKPKFLTEKDLNMKIILNLLFALHNFHFNIKYIYQDLSRHNIMVNHNFDIFLSDFESSVPFNSEESSFEKDIFQFGKIVLYLCEKKENISQLSDKSLKVLNLILNQCNNSSSAKHGSTLLFIYEIKFFGGLYPDNNKEIFNKIFKENEPLLNESSIVTFESNLQFQNYASSENRKMFSYFYKFSNIKFVALLFEICYDNGYILKKNHKKALNYFLLNHFGNKTAEFSNFFALTDKNANKQLLLNLKLGLIYMKGIGTQRDYSKSRSFFEKAKKLANNDDSLYCNYRILQLDEKSNNSIDCEFYSNLVNDPKIKDNNLKSKILLHIALILYKKAEICASDYFLKAISFNPNNYKAIKNFSTLYFNKSKSILPENSSYFKEELLLSGKTYESLGDIYFANNDKLNCIHYYSNASKLGELKASLKLALIYSSGEFKDDLKSIFYFSRIINTNIDPELKSEKKKKIYEYKLFSNIFLLKFKIKFGCISIDKLKQYSFFSIDYENKIIEDKNDQYYFNFGQKHFPDDLIISLFCFDIASNMNNSEAQFNLGSIYYEGKYVLQDINKAIHYLSLASNLNHQRAQEVLGSIYFEGEEVSQDIDKAIFYFKLAGDSESYFNLGLIYFEGIETQRDLNEAIKYFTLSAEQNNREAQYNLGMIYNDGEQVPRDINKAIHYFKLASDQHLTAAYFQLGTIYYDQNNIDESITYYKLASDQNYPEAQYKLGLIYYEGKHVNKSINQAIFYFKLASNLKFQDAQFILGFIYYSIDSNISINYYKEASNSNNFFAKVNLAIIYLKNKNFNDAKNLLENSIREKSDILAIHNLATFYFYDDKNKFDESIHLLFKSAIAGFVPSENLLAVLIVKKLFGKFNLQNFNEMFLKNGINNVDFQNKILNIIKNNNLMENISYQNFYFFYKKKYYIYDIYHQPHDFT